MKKYDNVDVVAPQTEESASSSTLGRFSLLTVFLVTVLLIGGMIADRQRVAMAFVCGVAFFAFFGGMVIFVLSGQLGAIVVNHQSQVTVRMRDRMHFELYEREVPQASLVELPQLTDLPPVPKSLSFVPAVPRADEQLKLSSYDFVVGLFGEDGAPNPERILPESSKSPGQIQAKKPRPEVVEYLMGLRMIRVNEKRMLFFDTERYSTLRECQQAIKHNIAGGR